MIRLCPRHRAVGVNQLIFRLRHLVLDWGRPRGQQQEKVLRSERHQRHLILRRRWRLLLKPSLRHQVYPQALSVKEVMPHLLGQRDEAEEFIPGERFHRLLDFLTLSDLSAM